MNKYRTHNCNELRKDDLNKDISISGWINKKRDHGNLLFIDLRDNYGLTQCLIDKSSKDFYKLEKIQLDKVRSQGYSFQIEMNFRAWRKKARIKEKPIIFTDRTIGESKMSKAIMYEAIWMVWRLRIWKIFGWI